MLICALGSNWFVLALCSVCTTSVMCDRGSLRPTCSECLRCALFLQSAFRFVGYLEVWVIDYTILAVRIYKGPGSATGEESPHAWRQAGQVKYHNRSWSLGTAFPTYPRVPNEEFRA